MTRILVPLALTTLSSCAIVQPGQAGVRYFGWGSGLSSEVKNEGYYAYWPWDGVEIFDVTWKTNSEQLEALTSEGLHVPVEVAVTYRPLRSELPRLALELGRGYYASYIRPPLLTLMRTEFSRHAYNELAAMSPEIEKATLDSLRAGLAGRPIEISSVSIEHIEYDPAITRAISEKRVAAEEIERQVAEKMVAEEKADIHRIEARGHADSLRLVAQGEADAIVARGVAQAKAQDAIGRTLTRDYLRYKAFDGDQTRFYFVPVGKDGLPIIVGDDRGPVRRKEAPDLPPLASSDR